MARRGAQVAAIVVWAIVAALSPALVRGYSVHESETFAADCDGWWCTSWSASGTDSAGVTFSGVANVAINTAYRAWSPLTDDSCALAGHVVRAGGMYRRTSGTSSGANIRIYWFDADGAGMGYWPAGTFNSETWVYWSALVEVPAGVCQHQWWVQSGTGSAVMHASVALEVFEPGQDGGGGATEITAFSGDALDVVQLGIFGSVFVGSLLALMLAWIAVQGLRR